tara:strand:+ start:1641 stop:1826 length:186 start_codon:yes stop_codon:yes gene_type:complete
MLILTRNIGEAIIINENITVTFLGKNKYGQMRVGIDAPKDISVHREEIHRKIQDQKDSANG